MLKYAVTALVTMSGFSSLSLAHLEDHFECHSSLGQPSGAKPAVTFLLDLVNHPEIELQNYDSAKHPDSLANGEIKSVLLVHGRKMPTQVRSLSVKRGPISDIKRQGPNGKVCIIGNHETSIRYEAAVKVGSVTRQVRFLCTNTSKLPDETMYCE